MPTVSAQPLRLAAHAKINLGLEVLHKRDDGFHAIDTLFLRISLADTITVKAALKQHLQVTCVPTLDVPQEQNLAYKAASLLASEFPKHPIPPTHIHIKKRIPLGGGLGGGSTDAAYTLLALNEYWGINADKSHLQALAAQLGSDIPFFILDVPASVAWGRGEVLMPCFKRPFRFWILLVCSGIHISTAWAYKALGRTEDHHTGYPSDFAAYIFQSFHHPERFREFVTNDFESVVFQEHPSLERIKSGLYDAGAFFALMSGSGSTMYGLFRTKKDAQAAQKLFAEHTEYKDYTTFVCKNV
jgi:4-diphosphocytidyl-2-C-methyl-D-erythritol kinase